LINVQVTDLISETEKRIQRHKLKSCADVKKAREKIVSFSKEMILLRKPLREFLMERLYRHYRVIRMSNKAKLFIQKLFEYYIDRPEALPSAMQNKIRRDGVRRVVCDYIAGMTDRYALDEYKKLFDPYQKV
jgi:dGTPase